MSDLPEAVQNEAVRSPRITVVAPRLSPSETTHDHEAPEALSSTSPLDLVPIQPPSPDFHKVLSPTPSQYQVLLLEQLHDRELMLQLIQRQDALQKTMDGILRKLEPAVEAITPSAKTISLFITEKEAAQMAGLSPKTLADRRRADRVPRELYRQDSRKGQVKYNARKWQQHIGLED